MPLVFAELDLAAMQKVRRGVNLRISVIPAKFLRPRALCELGPPVTERVVNGVRIERF